MEIKVENKLLEQEALNLILFSALVLPCLSSLFLDFVTPIC